MEGRYAGIESYVHEEVHPLAIYMRGIDLMC